MARLVGRSRITERNGMRIQFSELIIMVAIAIGLAAGVRWYFVVYRNSPGFTLGEYLGAVKAGNVERQYELIDDADKPAKWYFALKQARLEAASQVSEATPGAPIAKHPMDGPVELHWRS